MAAAGKACVRTKGGIGSQLQARGHAPKVHWPADLSAVAGRHIIGHGHRKRPARLSLCHTLHHLQSRRLPSMHCLLEVIVSDGSVMQYFLQCIVSLKSL